MVVYKRVAQPDRLGSDGQCRPDHVWAAVPFVVQIQRARPAAAHVVLPLPRGTNPVATHVQRHSNQPSQFHTPSPRTAIVAPKVLGHPQPAPTTRFRAFHVHRRRPDFPPLRPARQLPAPPLQHHHHQRCPSLFGQETSQTNVRKNLFS